MKKHVITIITILLSAITCGATFLFALLPPIRACGSGRESRHWRVTVFPQFVDRDALEDKDEPSRVRLVRAVSVAGVVGRISGQPVLRGLSNHTQKWVKDLRELAQGDRSFR